MSGKLLFLLGFPLVVYSHPDLSISLKSFEQALQANPSQLATRAQRAWLLLEHEQLDASLRSDIDSLLAHKEWQADGKRFLAYHLFLQGHLSKAKVLLLKNMQSEATFGSEQFRLLARLYVKEKDTLSAIETLRKGWDKKHEESDFIEILRLYQAIGQISARFLKEGMSRHNQSPAVLEAVYTVFYESKQKDEIEQALVLSDKAVSIWPRSIDWKIKRAKALLLNELAKEAENQLLTALELLDEDSRLALNSKAAKDYRKEILTYLQQATIVKGKL